MNPEWTYIALAISVLSLLLALAAIGFTIGRPRLTEPETTPDPSPQPALFVATNEFEESEPVQASQRPKRKQSMLWV